MYKGEKKKKKRLFSDHAIFPLISRVSHICAADASAMHKMQGMEKAVQARTVPIECITRASPIITYSTTPSNYWVLSSGRYVIPLQKSTILAFGAPIRLTLWHADPITC